MSRITKEGVATSHVRRVTLNLIRLSASCPAVLRPVLDRLREADWEMSRLSREDVESIYAYVDDHVATTALREFEADPASVIDRKYAGDNILCKLCGHEHIRFEFLLKNNSGGQDVWTGSRCIIEYGINVLGEETAEAALKTLKRVLADKRREYDAWEWRQEHPDAEQRINEMRSACLEGISPFVDVAIWRKLPRTWIDDVREMQRQAEGTVAYYEQHAFLLKARTPLLYGPNSLIGQAASLRQTLAVAEEA